MSDQIIDGEIIQRERIEQATTSLSPLDAFTPTIAHAPATLPVPDAPVTVRTATMEDLPAIDALQKRHSRQLGFFPRQQLEGYIRSGWVLVAEGQNSDEATQRPSDEGKADDATIPSSLRASVAPSLLGYCASRDRYQKRDELGAVFQMCVSPEAQRRLVGATLLKAVFERASYGCRLFCCWCAQDLKPANRFWEAMGFVPLAFRAGSKAKDRVHIFWQKRIRTGDDRTPWWFPACTGGGALREDRIVLPIPPGTNWWDAMPRITPGRSQIKQSQIKRIEDTARPPRQRSPKPAVDESAGPALSGLQFGMAKPQKPKRERGVRIDPEQAARARELRDRFLEHAVEGTLCLPAPQARYEVSRAVEASTAPPLLEAA
jgi:GNAT superfamily N-acetyltransferase